jgi:hypothetical protein
MPGEKVTNWDVANMGNNEGLVGRGLKIDAGF